MHSQTEETEQDSQEIENCRPISLHEVNSSNIREGGGETGEIEEPRSPLEVIQTPSSLDKGSAVKIIQNKAEEPEEPKSPRIIIQQGTLIILDQGSVVKVIPTPSSQPRNNSLEIPEVYSQIFDQMAQNQQTPQTSTLQYPIVDIAVNAPMKAIPLQHIPTFHGLTSEDLDAFLFKFDVLCRGYDYTSNPQKLKLFPSTLKGTALRWFMGLGGGVINDWDQMKATFLKKYQDYCNIPWLNIGRSKSIYV